MGKRTFLKGISCFGRRLCIKNYTATVCFSIRFDKFFRGRWCKFAVKSSVAPEFVLRKGLIGLIPREETEGKGHLYVAPLVPERKLNQRKKAFPF